MHADEHAITARTARDLIAAGMPDLADLPLRRVGGAGTDNVLFRLGPDLVARFPRLPHAEAQIGLLARWLPDLAPHLPLSVPLIDRIGEPDFGYPCSWAVGPWLAGRDAFAAPPDQKAAAADLADFLQALHGQPAPDDAPLRGKTDRLDLTLAGLDPFVAQFEDEADPALLRRLVAKALKIPVFRGPPVWVHGDLHPLNLLTQRGRLSGVIDWGLMGLGDPGLDMMVAWTMLDGPARHDLHDRLQPDPAAWARGWAQALAKAIMAIPYYRRSNPVFHAAMRRTLERVLEEGAE